MPTLPERYQLSYDVASLVGHLGLRPVSRWLLRRAERDIARYFRTAPAGSIRAVDRRPGLSPDAFRAEYVARGLPVVMPGFARHWPAVGRWSPRYLADRYGDDAYVAGDRDEGESRFNRAGGQASKMTLSEFADRVDAGRRVNGGFDSIVHRHPELQEELLFEELEPYLPPGRKPGIRDTFMGAANTATAIHSALNNNLFTCVYGVKRWYFFHPRLDWAMRPHNARTPYFISDCIPEGHDPEEHPLFRWADGLVVDLDPGDVLYLPSLWWHYVINVTSAIGVGFRWINLAQAFATAPYKTLRILTATNPTVLRVELAKRNDDFSYPFRLQEDLLD